MEPTTERAASPTLPSPASRRLPPDLAGPDPLTAPWISAPLLATLDLDRDGSFATVSGPWSRALGWSPEELLTASMLDRVHADDREATRDALARLARGEQSVSFQHRFMSRDGRWTALHWDALRPFGGPVFALVRDVEQQRSDALSRVSVPVHRAENDPRRANALDATLRAVRELTECAFVFVAEARRSDSLPPSLTPIASAARDGAVANLPRWISSDLESPWAQALKTGEPTRVAFSEALSFSDLPVAAKTFLSLPIKGPEGVLGVLVLARDHPPFDEASITGLAPLCDALATLIDLRGTRERLARLESEARRGAALFTAVINPADVSVITTDARGAIESMNPAAHKLLGPIEPERIRSMNLAAFIDPEQLVRVRRELPPGRRVESPFDVLVARALERGGVDRREWTWVSLDGVRSATRMTVSALRDQRDTVVGWAVVSAEPSEHSAVERERARSGQLESQLALLRRRETETARLNEACEYASASRSLREALNVIGSFLPSIFGDDPPQLLVQRRGAHLDDGPAEQTPSTFRAIEQRACWALKTGQVFISESGALRCSHLDGDHDAWVCAPLADGARTLAALSARLESPPPAPRGAEPEGRSRRISGLHEQARHFSSVLSNLRLRRTLEEQATRDPLTGAVNRRQLEHELKLTVHRHQKTGQPFALLVLDVDHFKHINDQHGHDRGDRVLAGLGALVRKRLRDSDVLARVGGEEFVVLLRAIDRPNSARVAEHLRESIEGARLAGNDLPCTCSIGALHVHRGGASIDELLRRADRALYEAKAAGRNRVVFAEGDGGAGGTAPVPPASEGARSEGASGTPR
jgi:diguanylate cyclase (GGDEF)-like protein/PAS domain S-box-containing protein